MSESKTNKKETNEYRFFVEINVERMELMPYSQNFFKSLNCHRQHDNNGVRIA